LLIVLTELNKKTMNKKAQEILEKHLKESDKIGLNKCVINAMKEFAKDYHTEELTLNGVVASKCKCDAPLIRTGDKDSEYCGKCELDL
jgi:hypothetical protein